VAQHVRIGAEAANCRCCVRLWGVKNAKKAIEGCWRSRSHPLWVKKRGGSFDWRRGEVRSCSKKARGKKKPTVAFKGRDQSVPFLCRNASGASRREEGGECLKVTKAMEGKSFIGLGHIGKIESNRIGREKSAAEGEGVYEKVSGRKGQLQSKKKYLKGRDLSNNRRLSEARE